MESREVVLVDTSVFIDFFRGKKPPTFEELLLNDQIILSNFVRLELLQGVRKSEADQLKYVLEGIQNQVFQIEAFETAESILERIRGTGMTVGIVDLLIAAEANIYQCPIYSHDKVFEELFRRRLIPNLWLYK